MAEVTPNPEPIRSPDVNAQEASAGQGDIGRRKEASVGKEEEQTAGRIHQGGNEDKVVKDIAEGAIIDMVQGPDGKWTTKDPRDPSYFYDPATRPSQPASSFEEDLNQRVAEADQWQPGQAQRNTRGGQAANAGVGNIKQGVDAAWNQWQAGQPQRDAQFEQIRQNADRAWENFQQQTNPGRGSESTPNRQPATDMRQEPQVSGRSSTPTGEPISPRDRFNEMERQQEAQRQQKLITLQTEGNRLANIALTPEGQQTVAQTRQILTQIVDILAENSKPRSIHQVGVVRTPDPERISRWQQQKQQQVEALLRGGQMDNLQENAYLTLVTGRQPLPTNDAQELQRRRDVLEQFRRLRLDIGRAQNYQDSEVQPIGQRQIPISEGQLKFYGITAEQAQQAFARGWDEIKIGQPQPDNREAPKNSEDEPIAFNVITQEQVGEYKRMLAERYGIDLSNVSVDIARPGDEVFDAEEIKFRYFQQPDDPSLGPLRELLEQREANPQSVPIDRLRAVAEERGIVLEGRMPGFAAVSGDNRIIFFAVRDADAISMAQRYAEKEGEAGRSFATSEEASNYLRGLGEKAFLHEVGHVVYGRTGEASISEWTGYVEANQQLKDRVIAIQEDKYENVTEIPVAEEAFADYFVDVVGGGRVNSRLEPDPGAIRRVSQILIPEQPANRVHPRETEAPIVEVDDDLLG